MQFYNRGHIYVKDGQFFKIYFQWPVHDCSFSSIEWWFAKKIIYLPLSNSSCILKILSSSQKMLHLSSTSHLLSWCFLTMADRRNLFFFLIWMRLCHKTSVLCLAIEQVYFALSMNRWSSCWTVFYTVLHIDQNTLEAVWEQGTN